MVFYVWNYRFYKIFGKSTTSIEILYIKVNVLDNKNAKNIEIKNGNIEFKNVTFRYEEDSNLIFKNFSCKIDSGQKIGLVGESGSGKSTFISLLLRLYDINEGEILIDNQNINFITQDSLYQNISLIPQDPSLFHRFLYDNILYGSISKTKEDLINSSKLASAHDFIVSTENGYQTIVGERGVKLSGGQRQRVAIARAFLKSAPILILDEATSALDSTTEKEIQKSLWELMKGKKSYINSS